ncbi:MAG: hypothetical protein JW751_08900 [Polyangiaceae bacterium]|nr:hypothetical protein [Polyangiaceae bacterium]
MNQLGPEARSLLKCAMAEERPASMATMRRVRQGVRLAVLGAIPAQAAAAATVSASMVKLMVVGFGVGLASLGVTHWASESLSSHADDGLAADGAQQPPSAPPAVGPRPLASAPPQAEVTESPVLVPDQAPAVPSARLPERPRSASAPQVEPGLQAELVLLSRVQALLRRGDGEQALELLDRHRGPLGGSQQLAEERLAAEVFAACAAGDRVRARWAAEQFLRRAPASPLAPRVRSSCGVLPP